MLPIEWRTKAGLSQEHVAKCIGLAGLNPARTWSRYERGERQPRPDVIAAVEKLSRGKIKASSWADARAAHIEKSASAPAHAHAGAGRATREDVAP
ncbi:helix-turn-helix domain-containing protein [Bosea lathyri]|uniref:helix-turn-helix domain-containing protein n=1 Tax=Bosea lathyri TaxID=1036778 RepID=UPI000CDE9EA9